MGVTKTKQTLKADKSLPYPDKQGLPMAQAQSMRSDRGTPLKLAMFQQRRREKDVLYKMLIGRIAKKKSMWVCPSGG